MRKLFIYFFIVVNIAGCTPKIFDGMRADSKKIVQRESIYPFFDRVSDSTVMFNMQLSFKDNDVDGFLLVKFSADGSARTVYTSIPGLTIFDFEVSADSFIVYRCIEPMRKKVVLNLFKNDFRTLFLYNVPPTFKAKTYTDSGSRVGYKVKTDSGKAFYLTDTAVRELHKIRKPHIVTLLNMEFSEYRDGFPKIISISHPKLKLSMQLERVWR